MCLFHVSFLSTVTPRISSSSTSLILVVQKNRSVLVGCLFRDIVIALHLVGSNATFHLSAHVFILARSLFRPALTVSASLVDLISQKRVESSAYRYRAFSQWSARSSMKTENRSGPSIDPCGTDALIDVVANDWPERTTLINLHSRPTVFLWRLSLSTWEQRPLRQTLPKAPLMSSATSLTSFALSSIYDHCWERMVRTSAVLWWGLKPNCLSEIRWYLSR